MWRRISSEVATSIYHRKILNDTSIAYKQCGYQYRTSGIFCPADLYIAIKWPAAVYYDLFHFGLHSPITLEFAAAVKLPCGRAVYPFLHYIFSSKSVFSKLIFARQRRHTQDVRRGRRPKQMHTLSTKTYSAHRITGRLPRWANGHGIIRTLFIRHKAECEVPPVTLPACKSGKRRILWLYLTQDLAIYYIISILAQSCIIPRLFINKRAFSKILIISKDLVILYICRR